MATVMERSGGVVARSSLEVMLDSLMRRDEKPKDTPPALPARPPSRGRLPSSRKPLPPLPVPSAFNNGEKITDPELPSPHKEEQEEEIAKKKELSNGITTEIERPQNENEKLNSDSSSSELVCNKETCKQEKMRASERRVELETQNMKAETKLKQREEEISQLRQQLQQYEARCVEYESRIRTLEDINQGHLASLQTEQNEVENGNSNHEAIADTGDGKQNGGVGYLIREFEQKKRSFEDNACMLSEWKAGQTTLSTNNPVDDFRRLKAQFVAWKKEFKSKLRSTKLSLDKLDRESNKSHRSWWGSRKTVKL